MSPRYRLFRGTLRTLGVLFLAFEAHGEEKVPEKGPLIVAANHHRFFDPVFVSMAVPRRVRWMAKKELFRFPFARFFYFLGTFPVDRQGGGRTALRTAVNLLAEERALGTAVIAARSGAPVLPVFVGRIPGPAARLRGEKFRVYVGHPMTIDNTVKGREGHRRAADEILCVIYALPEGPL